MFTIIEIKHYIMKFSGEFLNIMLTFYLYHTSWLMHRDESSVMFPFGFMGGFGSCNSRSPNPNDPVGIDLTPTPIPAANLRIHSRRKKMTTEKVLYIILQQPIRAKLS